MNKELIQKVIECNIPEACLEFTYKNPLLDPKTAQVLAKSFVKMLNVSQEDTNMNIKLRHSVLANIRNLCRTEPENHIEVDDKFINSLTEVYLNNIEASRLEKGVSLSNVVERALDEFILRNIKDVDVNSNYQPSHNPEVFQALLNLNHNNGKLSSIIKDVLHWNMSDTRNLNVVKHLWVDSILSENTRQVIADISIRNRAQIESFLLNICLRLLTHISIKIEALFEEDELQNVVEKCSKSADCFQMCAAILNAVLIHTNFNSDIQLFINHFILAVKDKCRISLLYPGHLRHIVVLLDVELKNLPEKLKNKYLQKTLIHLKNLHEACENDFLMLLSHYSQWFDIYFDDNNKCFEKT